MKYVGFGKMLQVETLQEGHRWRKTISEMRGFPPGLGDASGKRQGRIKFLFLDSRTQFQVQAMLVLAKGLEAFS